MKSAIWMLGVAAGLAGWAVVGVAQEEFDGMEPDVMEEVTPYIVTGGLLHRIHTYNHSALQRRSDMENDSSESYEDGETDGSGWGAVMSVGRGTGKAVVSFISTDYDYDLLYPAGGGHRIASKRRDLDIYWQETTGTSERGHWGWKLGYRYIGVNNDITLAEKGSGRFDDSGDVTWQLVWGGYMGQLDAFGGKYVSLYGGVNGFLGEASGFARSGNDLANDGKIEEKYEDEYSVAYGAEIKGGITFHLLQDMHLSVDYAREWLYSFDSTSTGTVVFPDNDDALFIENNHRLTATLSYIF